MAMKVILREDVPNVGRSGELVNVKPGFGRNYLLPRKLAVLANESNVAQLEHDRAVISARQAKLRGNAEEQAKRIGAVSVTIARKVGEQDKLFGSVTALDIAEALAAKGQKVETPSGLALKLLRKLHQTTAKITLDFEGRWHFNTCVAAIMELVNEVQGADAQLAAGEVPPAVIREILTTLVLLLGPFAPFLCAELWEMLGEESNVLRAPWPISDPELAKEDEKEIPVQINGKLVTVVRVAADADPKAIETAALADEKVKGRIEGKTVVKIIVIPGRATNLVVK